MAEQIGVDKSTIQYWENNQVVPAVCHMPKIIEFLGYVPYVPTESFSERLRIRREALGLSQRKLAKLLNKDVTTLAGWETGKHRPTRKSRTEVEAFFTSCTSSALSVRFIDILSMLN